MRRVAIVVALALSACGPTNEQFMYPTYSGAGGVSGGEAVLGASLIQAGAGLIAPAPPPPAMPLTCFSQPFGRGYSTTCR